MRKHRNIYASLPVNEHSKHVSKKYSGVASWIMFLIHKLNKRETSNKPAKWLASFTSFFNLLSSLLSVSLAVGGIIVSIIIYRLSSTAITKVEGMEIINKNQEKEISRLTTIIEQQKELLSNSQKQTTIVSDQNKKTSILIEKSNSTLESLDKTLQLDSSLLSVQNLQ